MGWEVGADEPLRTIIIITIIFLFLLLINTVLFGSVCGASGVAVHQLLATFAMVVQSPSVTCHSFMNYWAINILLCHLSTHFSIFHPPPPPPPPHLQLRQLPLQVPGTLFFVLATQQQHSCLHAPAAVAATLLVQQRLWFVVGKSFFILNKVSLKKIYFKNLKGKNYFE